MDALSRGLFARQMTRLSSSGQPCVTASFLSSFGTHKPGVHRRVTPSIQKTRAASATLEETPMRRHNVLLLAQARHDPAARCEVGRRYLLGIEGLARHVPTGISYLTHPSLQESPQAATIICECLALEEIVSLRQELALERAAKAGSAEAQFKLAIWLCLRHDQPKACMRWLAAATSQGHEPARHALAAVGSPTSKDGMLQCVRSVSRLGGIQVESVATLAAKALVEAGDLYRLARCLHIALAVATRVTAAFAHLVVQAVHLAEQAATTLPGIGAAQVEACLDLVVADGDRTADYVMGRALCGISCGTMAPASLVQGSNLRKGSALLLRAADAGCDAAWMHLYKVHADHRCSVANPQMARFFLEKAATLGDVEAQRRLGALILRSSTGLKESERGIHWLYESSRQGDTAAMRLLRSLVLRLPGDDGEADQAIEVVRRTDPWLAMRLRLSRDFGLTKLEALCIDPVQGKRSWGLVVGKNPFIALSKLSAPRAVPAVSPAALDNLHRATLFFDESQRSGNPFEGDWRKRSLQQRRVFARHQIDEDMFFARANSRTLEALRQGAKWALRAKHPLQLALAA